MATTTSAADTNVPIFKSIEDTAELYALVIDDVCINVARQFESYGWDSIEIQNKLKLFKNIWQQELDNSGAVNKVNNTQRRPLQNESIYNNTANITQNTVKSQQQQNKKRKPDVAIPDTQQQQHAIQTSNATTQPITYPQYNTYNPSTYNNTQPPDNTYTLNTAHSDIPQNPYEQDTYNTTYNNNTIPQTDGANDTSDDEKQIHNDNTNNVVDPNNTDNNNNLSFQQYIDASILNQRTDIDSEILGTQDDDDSDIDEPTDNIILCTYEKVTHQKNKWKVNLTHGIMIIQGRDYMFSKLNGEFDW